MHRSVYGLLGVAAALGLAVSCKDDPTSTLRGGPALLTLEFDYREVVVRDSVKVTAVVRDGQNNPLPDEITVSIPAGCTAGIASVTPTSAAPLPVTAFFLKGLAYGTTCVVAQSGGLTDTMQVATFPARIAVIGPDTMNSGDTLTFGFTYFDAAGNAMTGVPAPSWTTTDANIAAVTATGLVSARAPGQARVEATGTGSPEAGITFGRTFIVKPGPFAGTISRNTGAPGDTIKYTRAAAGAVFDADSRFTINGVRTFPFNLAADSVRIIVPGVGTTSPSAVLMTSVGPNQVAYTTPFTATTALFADPYDAVNDDPTTGPVISTNGDYYIVMHGTCVDGVVTDPGDDCDDFFTITNAGGVPDTMTVRVDWFTTADVDILWLNSGGTGFVGNFNGATSVNPEQSTVFVPAGATWRLWINLFAPGGPSTIVRVRVTNKN